MQAAFSMQRSVKKSKNILSFTPIPLGSTSAVRYRGRRKTITPLRDSPVMDVKLDSTSMNAKYNM